MIGTDNLVSKMTTPTSETMTPPDNSSSSDESEIDFSSSDMDPEALQVANAESSPSSKKESSPVAQKETALVVRSKLLVYIFLVVLAVVVGIVAYVFISREEAEDLEVKVR
jgi:cobalamin biosynthesis Mg chelatase CobN